MEPQSNPTTTQSFFEKNKTLIKGFLIGFLIIIMLIPTAMIMGLINEREGRQKEVIQDISSKWASEQTVVGPVLAIPYLRRIVDKNNEERMEKKIAYILPEELEINGELLPENRHRSIYDVTVYRSQLSLKGSFSPEYLKKMNIDSSEILWHKIELLVGIDDARGLEEEVKLKWGSTKHTLEATLETIGFMNTALGTTITYSEDNPTKFEIDLMVKGTGKLFFVPFGKTTVANIKSDWKDPAFGGQYLPNDYKITESGFNANWKVLQVSRGYPQFWESVRNPHISTSAFGVELLQPADGYAKTERSVKYAILIIALTFVVFFFIEIMQKKQIHPLQYILVGIALCIFYTLLLSISEYTGFNPAYLIAAIATVLLISWYVYSIIKSGKVALGIGSALTGLYVYIFFLIQLKDYALLFGSVGLFIILFVIMYYSRNIDWYHTGKKLKNENHE